MTYEELLAKVSNYKDAGLGSLVALRAVVELHKPRNYKAGNWCVGCNADYEHPCPTIQAIEKELA